MVRHYLGVFLWKEKVKYDYAFKLECVQLVLESHYSCESVSKEKDLMNPTTFVNGLGFTINMARRSFARKKKKIKKNFKVKGSSIY